MRKLPIAALAATLTACGGDDPPGVRTDLTGIRLAMIYNANLALDELAITATLDSTTLNSGTVQPATGQSTTEITETVVILLDDALAGKTIDLTIIGRKTTQPLAEGRVSAILTGKQLVDAAVRLQPLTPTACGDGRLDTAETCDDQNIVAGDGCNTTCTIETGYTCAGTPSICTRDPQAECGNGVIETLETCDDANILADDGCNTTCTIEPGYACIGAPSVCARTCGDDAMSPGESCDDGNMINNDGCSDVCAIEPGFECPMFGEPCKPISPDCGNGQIGDNEACDDTNQVAGDGCSAGCELEMGWKCEGEPSVCVMEQATCGDGVIEALETCDDQNTANDDGCSESCAIEDGWICTGAPSACTRCGNGMIDEQELCDGGEVGIETCLSRGHLDGALGCNASCSEYDVGGCGSAIDTAAEIQQAIDQAYARAGGPEVVAVQPGMYALSNELLFDECANPCPNGPSGLILRPLSGTVSISDGGFRVRSGNNRIENFSVIEVSDAVQFERQSETSGGNTLASMFFIYEVVEPGTIVAVRSDNNTIIANRVRNATRDGGIAVFVDAAAGTTVAMNLLYGRFDRTIYVTGSSSSAQTQTLIDQNSVWIQGGGTAVELDVAQNVCYRNNIIWGNGFSTGVRVENVGYATGCPGGDTGHNLSENHGQNCSGIACTFDCTLGGPLCDISTDPGFDQAPMGQRTELCIRPVQNNVLIDAGLDLGYDLIDDSPDMYDGMAPELGARESGASRVFGGVSINCP